MAAEKAGMSLMEYVIGGMDQDFKLKLYRALRAMDEAGLSPGSRRLKKKSTRNGWRGPK